MSEEVYTSVDPDLVISDQTTLVPPNQINTLLQSWMGINCQDDDHMPKINLRFGKCIDCYPQQCDCYDDGEYKRPSDLYEDHITSFPMGNCPCGSAGTIAYKCMECGSHEYSQTWYPRDDRSLLHPVNYMHYALARGKQCWIIIPPRDIECMTNEYDYTLTQEGVQVLAEWEEVVARQEQTNHNIRLTEELLQALRSGGLYTTFPCRLDDSGNWINKQTGANTSAIENFRLNTSTSMFLPSSTRR